MALRVTKTGPDELLRGVHAAGIGGPGGTEGALWTIEVEANPDYDIDTVGLVDVLHPGLEFLGCDTYTPPDASPWVDNTTAGEEWTGSGPVATGAGCAPQPLSIDTLGTGATEVRWDLGDILAGTTSVVTYQAGIPLYANEPFVGGPTAASLRQGRNLDNNTGPSTGEGDRTTSVDPELLGGGEQTFDNTATASGTYTPTGAIETDDDVEFTESEDLAIAKSSSGSLVQGTTVVSTLTISASEYRDFSNLVVRDLLPSALCFLGTYSADLTPGGSDWATNDCPGRGLDRLHRQWGAGGGDVRSGVARRRPVRHRPPRGGLELRRHRGARRVGLGRPDRDHVQLGRPRGLPQRPGPRHRRAGALG